MRFAPIALDAAHRALRDDVRACLHEVVTEEVHLDEYRFGHGPDWRVHRALGARGWLYPELPVEEGGAGLDALSSVIVAHEMERARVPGRGQRTTSMVAGVVRAHGPESVRDEVLLRAARGEIIMCLGWTEPESGSDVAAASCRAIRDGDDWVINGQKLFTSGADHAAYTFLLTRTDFAAPKHRGLTTFLVPLDLAGIEIRAVRTVGGETQHHRVLRRCPRGRPLPARCRERRVVGVVDAVDAGTR